MSERDAMVGTNGADLIAVDQSISFTWMPDPGVLANTSELEADWDNFTFTMVSRTEPSTASGNVTFNVPSSMAFDGAMPSDLQFNFTRFGSVETWMLGFSSGGWNWDPGTGALSPWGVSAVWDDIIGYNLGASSVSFFVLHGFLQHSSQESGHWAVVDNPIDTDVFGGAGNDTIYGGMGSETLSGDAGDDQIHVGFGDDTVFGGSGNDTIWGGVGTQLLMGDAGNDVIRAGTGAMTMLGGDGKDTLYGGSGTQFLSGGDGADWLHAGVGNETLDGGSGKDVFAFGNGVSGRDVISDFRIGTDVLQVAAGINGLAVATVQDLRSHVTVGPGGVAVVTLGAASVTLTELSARQVQGHLSQVFRIG